MASTLSGLKNRRGFNILDRRQVFVVDSCHLYTSSVVTSGQGSLGSGGGLLSIFLDCVWVKGLSGGP